MRKNLILFPLFISSWILNSGFLFKPNIKVLTCGDNDYLSNISRINEKEILNDYPWIFDSNSGQIYAFDQYKNTLKPVDREIIDGIEYVYTNIFVRDGVVYIDSLDRNLETNDTIFTTTWLDVENLKVTYISMDGTSESSCKEIKLPKDVKILK